MHKEFERMLSNNQGRIKYIASRYCQHDEFDDMYQEILLQLWRSFTSFKGHSSRETWLYKVALNTACTFVSKSIKHKKIKEVAPQTTNTDGSLGQESCQADILNNFMNSLNDTDASVLMMYLDGLSSENNAEVIGISAKVVGEKKKQIKEAFKNKYLGVE